MMNKRLSRLAQIGAALTLSTALSVGSYGVATASPTSENQVQDLIQRVAPDAGAVVRGKAVSGKTSYTVKNLQVQISEAPSSPVSLKTADSPELLVGLPSNLKLNSGKTSSDGTVIYKSGGTGVDAAVQALSSGAVRIQTVLRSNSDPKESVYELGNGYTPTKAADGTYWAYKIDSTDKLSLFKIHDAWARDAAGNSIPTSYKISGNKLIQTVTTDSNTQFPVVADPTWEWYNWAYGAGFNKAETKNLASKGGAAGFCATLVLFGFAVAAPWCGIFGAAIFLNASELARQNKCVFISVAPAPLAVNYVSKHCV